MLPLSTAIQTTHTNNMKHLAYLNKYFYKYRYRLLLGIVFVVTSNYFRVWMPKVIRQALDLVYDNIKQYQQLTDIAKKQILYSSVSHQLLQFAGMVLLLALIMGVFMYFMRQTIIRMSRLFEYDIRKEIFDHYEKLSTAFYKRNNTGDLMSRISEDVSKVRMYMGPAVLYGINLVSLFTLAIYSMLKVNWELTLYALAPLPILSISIYYISNIINKKSEGIQKQLAFLTSTSQEVYSGIRVVKSYVQEASFSRFFQKQTDEYRSQSLSLARTEAFFHPLMMLLVGVSTIITVYIGIIQAANGKATPGNIAEFVIYVNMLTWPVMAIGWVASIVQQAAASQKRINEFLFIQPEIVNTAPPSTQHLKGEIQFKDVCFTYPDTGIQALKNINFHLLPGQKVIILGKTGSGKTSLAELLLRTYDVSEGSILIDQKDLREQDINNIRRRVGYVPQDVFLFSDTIANNIAFGKRDATPEQIATFAKYAAIKDDIEELPDGFETLVGERGVTLSGGQKQRISIARALIKTPDIVLMDDCLSAVDANTEKQILSYFSDALSDKTAIIITHRLYSHLHFDKIIVLDNGQISEMGTHEELLKRKGYYYNLYNKQKS